MPIVHNKVIKCSTDTKTKSNIIGSHEDIKTHPLDRSAHRLLTRIAVYITAAAHTHTYTIFTHTHTIFCSISSAISRLISVRQFPPVLPPVVLEENCGNKRHQFLCTRCPCCHPTNSIKALKRTQSMDSNHWSHDFFGHHRLLTEQATVYLCRLSYASSLTILTTGK